MICFSLKLVSILFLHSDSKQAHYSPTFQCTKEMKEEKSKAYHIWKLSETNCKRL